MHQAQVVLKYEKDLNAIISDHLKSWFYLDWNRFKIASGLLDIYFFDKNGFYLLNSWSEKEILKTKNLENKKKTLFQTKEVKIFPHEF